MNEKFKTYISLDGRIVMAAKNDTEAEESGLFSYDIEVESLDGRKGFNSWAGFDDLYKRQDFGFEYALAAARKGVKVSRKAWSFMFNDPSITALAKCIWIDDKGIVMSKFIGDDDSKAFPLNALTSMDIFATDWFIVED